MTALTLALGASVAWGASDFLGGLAARRLPIVIVLLGAQIVGLALAAAVWAFATPQLPALDVFALGAAAGVAELLGFACLYRGLAIGEMTGGADATVAVLASLYPLTTVLLARALLHERLCGSRLAGVAAVLGGVALISASP